MVWFVVLKQNYMLIITVLIILSDIKIKNIVARLIFNYKEKTNNNNDKIHDVH